MKRRKWAITASGMLSIAALAAGAAGIANAMTVHDSAGKPQTGIELRGTKLPTAPAPAAPAAPEGSGAGNQNSTGGPQQTGNISGNSSGNDAGNSTGPRQAPAPPVVSASANSAGSAD